MATVGTFSKTRLHAAGSPRRHPQLLPHQGTLWSGGSDQRQHQNPSSKGPWLQESRLSAAQGSTHGGHQDRIHRSPESSLKCGSLRIPVQSPFSEAMTNQKAQLSVRCSPTFGLSSGSRTASARHFRLSLLFSVPTRVW